ncbi:MAG: hypothetical protein OEV35_02440 [Gallionellaceae bacterium]|nr:hypothetical protein [Gallionellaceae bacterium]
MNHDREFEQYLEGKSALTQLYAELPEVDLPRHLDAAILAEAHRAVDSRPGAKPKRLWSIPLGLVATLFLAVMIGLQVPSMLKDAAAPQQSKQESIALAAMDKSTAVLSAPAPLETDEIRQTGSLLAKSKSGNMRGETTTMPAEAEMPALAEPSAPAAVQEPASAKNRRSGALSVRPSPPLAVQLLPAAPARAARQMEQTEHVDVDSGATFSAEKKIGAQAADGANDALRLRAPAAASLAAPQPVQQESGLMKSAKEEPGDDEPRPEDWLKRIQKLKQEGKQEEAQKELAAFKKRYPDYPVSLLIDVRKDVK